MNNQYPTLHRPPLKGRGTASRPSARFLATHGERDAQADPDEPSPDTQLFTERSRRVITRNRSPDIPFDQSVNPYRGCEHGCIYCYARPSHAYLDLSPGLDFETKLFHKPDAAVRLAEELKRPGYRCTPIALGSNTDVYQPIERRLALTRSLLKVLAEFRHPVSIVTKSALVERDIDLLTDLARDNLIKVFFSVPTLDDALKRRLEPRAAAPARRLKAMARLADAGIPVGVMVAPVIPALTDHEMETVLARARDHGATQAGYVLLRLPHEVQPLFTEWLEQHQPGRAGHVLSLLRQNHGGREYDARFGARMRGRGQFADLLARRFRLACRRLGYGDRHQPLNTEAFSRPAVAGDQLPLF